nr:hypothetical protein [Mucilaginibacter sp. L294]
MDNKDKIWQLGMIYMVSSFAFFIVFLCIGNGYATFVFCTIYTLSGIGLMLLSHGQVKFLSWNEKSNPLGIALGYFWPVILMFYTGLTKYHLLSYNNLWHIAAVFASVLFVLLLATGINKAAGYVAGQVVVMLIASLFWGFGSAVVANCIFDGSAPQKYNTTIANRYTSTGRGVRYHLMIDGWRPGLYGKTVDVKKNEYEKAAVDTAVSIVEKKGLFNVPWFTYTIDAAPPVPAGSGNGNSPATR